MGELSREIIAAREDYEQRAKLELQSFGADKEARTESGIPLKILYTPFDVEGINYLLQNC